MHQDKFWNSDLPVKTEDFMNRPVFNDSRVPSSCGHKKFKYYTEKELELPLDIRLAIRFKILYLYLRIKYTFI